MERTLCHEIKKYLDNFNNDFEKQHGYIFCRCYDCFFPIILESYKKIRQDDLPLDGLANVIQSINDDYIDSENYKMSIRPRSGLKCGYDCIYYDNVPEACPLTFWEIDKSHLKLLFKLLDDFISL